MLDCNLFVMISHKCFGTYYVLIDLQYLVLAQATLVKMLLVCAALALALDFFNCSMSWFSQPALLGVMYGFPALLVLLRDLRAEYQVRTHKGLQRFPMGPKLDCYT